GLIWLAAFSTLPPTQDFLDFRRDCGSVGSPKVPTQDGAGLAKDGDCTADPGKARKRKGRRSRPFARPVRSAKPAKVQGRSGRWRACASPIARPKDNRRAPG